MDALANVIGPAEYCDETLKLRHKVQKLHWMGLDREAKQLAREIEEIEHGGPRIIALLTADTD